MFDSGVGGLTVAKAIRRVLPDAGLYYFGDTVHMPYGERSPSAIRSYVKTICQYLEQKGASSIVLACNTASALAYETAKEACPNLPVYNVIDPVVNFIAAHYAGKKVAVIGTRGTTSSGVYPLRLKEKSRDIEVFTLATPILASLIEENISRPEVITGIITHYLDRPGIHDADVLILACTHYPLIRNEISAVLGNRVEIIDPAEHVANVLKQDLQGAGGNGQMICEVSDYTDAFAEVARRIFGENLELRERRLWNGD